MNSSKHDLHSNFLAAKGLQISSSREEFSPLKQFMSWSMSSSGITQKKRLLVFIVSCLQCGHKVFTRRQSEEISTGNVCTSTSKQNKMTAANGGRQQDARACSSRQNCCPVLLVNNMLTKRDEGSGVEKERHKHLPQQLPQAPQFLINQMLRTILPSSHYLCKAGVESQTFTTIVRAY